MERQAIESRSNAAEYTVSEISMALKRTVEDVYGNVRVRGEISGYRGPHSSGHAYFALKDERARIEAVVWKTTMPRLKFRPEEGMEVIATGRLTTYPGSSKYQIVIESLEPAGAGALMALLEERKRRLQAEGLFDRGRKRPLPFMPCVVGVITSPTGSVIRDIIHRIKDRFPLHVLLWPVRVQGETTGQEVAAAVAGFDAMPSEGPAPRPDVIIVARGGGSLEDLWGFNDEALARAVAACSIPVISAVGHETDWTLVDLVADIRAPTPTGAAEMAVPVRADLEATLASLAARLRACTLRGLDRKRQAARAAARALPAPDQLLALPRRCFDEATSRLGRALATGTERRRARLGAVRLTPATLSRRIAEARRLTARDLARAQAALRGSLRERRVRFTRCAGKLSVEPVGRLRRRGAESLAALAGRGERCLEMQFERRRRKLVQAGRLLDTLSHRSVLERGFALVQHPDGGLVKRAAELSPSQPISLRFADGVVDAAVASGEAVSTPKPKPKPAGRDPGPSGGQGSLF